MKEKPTIGLTTANERFKSEFAGYLRLLRMKYPIPAYLIEGILAGALADIRKEVSESATDEAFIYAKKLEEYYEEERNDSRNGDLCDNGDPVVDADICADEK